MDLLYESKSEGRQLKNGELVAVFNGLKIDMSTQPSQNGDNGSVRTVDISYNGALMRSSILNGGIRSRMRLRSSNGPSPSQSQNGIPPSSAVVPATAVMPINNANGSLVQSPSSGAVRRTSGMNQWEQQQQPMPNNIPNNHQRLPQPYSNPVMAIPQSQQTPQPPPQAPQQGQLAGPGNGEVMPDDDDEELPQVIELDNALIEKITNTTIIAIFRAGKEELIHTVEDIMSITTLDPRKDSIKYFEGIN